MQGDKKPLHQVKNIALQLWDAPATCPQRPIARNLQGKFFFKQKFSLQQRIEKYKTMKEKVNSEDQVLIIAEVAGDLLKLSSQKYKIMSCNKSYNVGFLIKHLRQLFLVKNRQDKKIEIQHALITMSMHLFNKKNNVMIKSDLTIKQLWQNCRDKQDNFLYLQVLVMQNYG